MQVLFGGLLAALLLASAPAAAQAPEAAGTTPQQFVESLKFQDGDAVVAEAKARLKLGGDFRYLPQADARRVLEQLWGNPPDEDVLGLVVPRDKSLLADDSWAVVVTYSDEGHVADEDAAKIDYDELLTQMKDETRESNEARKQAGYEAIELVGWAEPPRYDAANKKLVWAKELVFGDSKDHTLNYDIRVLGRTGYLSLNAVAGMGQLADVQAGMRTLLPRVEFDPGARYADYREGSDKLAGYGLAALVGGGLAAKTGLLAKLGALLLAGKKFIVLLLVGLGVAVKRLLGRKKAGTVA